MSLDTLNAKCIRIRRVFRLYNPEKFTAELLVMNRTEWLKAVDTHYNDVLTAAEEIESQPSMAGINSADVEKIVDSITDSYQKFLFDYNQKCGHGIAIVNPMADSNEHQEFNKAAAIGCVTVSKEPKVNSEMIAKEVDTSALSIQCELHRCEAEVTFANIAHTAYAYEHSGVESSKQMIGNNGQVDQTGKERDPSATEVYNLSLGIQKDVNYGEELSMEAGYIVQKYTRVYKDAAIIAKFYDNYFLYEYEKVGSQMCEMEVYRYNAASSSWEKNNFQYHRNEG